MRAIGIISEYNPFHSGHRHQIAESRRLLGADCPVVCAMSGNWVQRGEPAIADKFTRAEAALRGGADLILELPTVWAASSAERFARGGIALLAATGVVGHLSFGSECGNLAPLRRAAQMMHGETWDTAVREHVKTGIAFPAARQKAAEELLGTEGAACLKYPNNNLGIEYLRAIRALNAEMDAVTIPRAGSGHDALSPSEHASGAWLREQLLGGSESLAPWLAPETEAAVRHDPASFSFCERAVFSSLRRLSPADWLDIPDVSEGLEQRLFRVAFETETLSAYYEHAKSRRFSHARIRRAALWAFLGLRKADIPDGPPYLRVLGFSARGQELLREMKTTASLPIVMKPARTEHLTPEGKALLAKEAACTDLYNLCRRHFGGSPAKRELSFSPVRIM